ncbi:hypothetical protein RchiOBHm_Chr7g0236351 [Rosa chinensis]|uniref:Uncharacterized protein n=1 Tax=Rosa chinensis TaxID=74649 RepID=A0A2P6PGW3_ROSCH|nr:hypothetical protein RchiOBHm_Chr7g0236351 [Rosa chinensis]
MSSGIRCRQRVGQSTTYKKRLGQIGFLSLLFLLRTSVHLLRCTPPNSWIILWLSFFS